MTVAALIANGNVEQLAVHAAKGRSNGLTRDEMGGLVAHLAIYSGWPRAWSAVPVVESAYSEAAD